MNGKENVLSSPTALFSSLGCKVAQYETEAIREAFLREGFAEVTDGADAVVVNTCTVTEESDRKCRKAIRRLVRENPHAHVLVIGCYAQSHPAEVLAIPGVSYVGGTADKMKTVAVAKRLLAGELIPPVNAVRSLEGEGYEPMCVAGTPRTRAYVKIADGCDCRCTYCAIPAARGPVRSRDRDEILAEIARLSASGVREVVLTGIETASYGRDRRDGYRLIDLLEDADRLPIERIRLGSLTPEVVRGDFAERAAALTHLCPHFHLSVQSGSDRVLARMRRRYNREMALSAIRSLRAAIPAATFTCDMIVGFPGESKEDFAETIDFAEKARFLAMHVFAYSPRKGTEAATMDGAVPPREKAERSRTLTALAARLSESVLTAALQAGEPLSVLFETEAGGTYTGHTPTFLPVCATADTDVRGRILSVMPMDVRDGVLFGKLI
ncbi:MAG: tRNA (N(6)-L-threonylcarbamoyladenosine(37)-C(2))-methylthiotransferase MtaB [Clostridia bacterium]|nr:tRNA (N(6)-L-threonylcarbamoyladenosine(37)-C(2))-methylthiotransferase MtaB [Clostridia bacterium]